MKILGRDRPVFDKRGYFARFFGFARAFGVNGSGGLVSIALSNPSVRRCASPCGSKSSLASSLARSAADSCLRLLIASPARLGIDAPLAINANADLQCRNDSRSFLHDVAHLNGKALALLQSSVPRLLTP